MKLFWTFGSSLKILVASTLGFIVALAVNNSIQDWIKKDPRRSRTPPIVIAIVLFIIALVITMAMAYIFPDTMGSVNMDCNSGMKMHTHHLHDTLVKSASSVIDGN